jgi:hypothetical protein
MRSSIIAVLAALLSVATPAQAEEAEEPKPACLRAKWINGWVKGNAQIVQLHTSGQRWRVTFTEPCMGKGKPLGFRFGIRVGSVCLEPGDELVFVTIGGYEQYCRVAKIELMKLGEKIVPDPAPETPEAP